MSFIHTEVIRKGKIGCICGHPGTGKSITTYYTVASYSCEYKIIWIACGTQDAKTEDVAVVIMHKGFKQSYHIQYRQLVHDIASMETSRAKTIFVLDDGGLMVSGLADLIGTTRQVVSKDGLKRQIFVSSSGLETTLTKLPDVVRNRFAVMMVNGWTLEDYNSAIRNTIFASSVSKHFQSETGQDFSSKIGSKFFFAGHCARYLFAQDTGAVKRDIEALVARVPNYDDLGKQLVGISPYVAVHPLFAQVSTGVSDESKVEFVARFALC
jgi:hypothetical protein